MQSWQLIPPLDSPIILSTSGNQKLKMPRQINAIPCPACGALSEPETGKTHMPCAYCGTTLTIPEELRTKIDISAHEKNFQQPEITPDQLLRKAQPVVRGAFNLYALWTWARWILPACLTIFIITIILCLALGSVPIVLKLTQ